MADYTSEVFGKVKELGQLPSKKKELEDYCKLKFNEIIKFLPGLILTDDGPNLLHYLLKGLSDQSKTSSRKVKVIDIILHDMRQECTSLTHCSEVMSYICTELRQQQTADHIRWADDSVQSIIEDNDANMIWRDILPQSMNIIMSESKITHSGNNMSGMEFLEHCIKKLCQCRWKDKQLIPLTAMFRDIKLLENHHKQIVNEICSYVMDVPPETLPPLVLELLKLCKEYHMEIVLSNLAHYFNIRLYAKLEPPPSGSETTLMETEDFVKYSQTDLFKCLSSCIYMFQDTVDSELMKKYFKLWPKPQLLASPFLISIALAFADKFVKFQSVFIDIIRAAIEQNILDKQGTKESAWIKSIIPPSVDVASVLKELTKECEYHNHLTTMGLINLGFNLLSTNRSKPVSSTFWSHGKLILVRLARNDYETTRDILSKLSRKLACESPSRQYTDCLYVLCKLTPMSVDRCVQLFTIVEKCSLCIPSKQAEAVLDAVHPLLNFSMKLRDVLVMVGRKGLHSSDPLQRSVALSGFLSLLRHIKLPRSISTSQDQCSDSMSNYSYLTQIYVDVHATQHGATITSRARNEKICVEVVFIIQRCLTQDAVIKQLFYSRIYGCTKEKTVLHASILEVLYEHLIKYLSQGNQSIILFEECVQATAITSVLKEPIGYLLYALAQFVQHSYEEELEDILSSQNPDTASEHYKSKLECVLNKLTDSEQLTSSTENDGVGLTDLTPESRAKSHILQQKLQCLEALIAHHILQWSLFTKNSASTLYRLYKCYNELVEHTKVTPKTGKKVTQKTQSTQKSQNEKEKGSAKLTNIVKDRAGPFKPLPCLWDLSICVRVVQLLYSEEVIWSSVVERNNIRSKKDFHHFALKNIQSVLSNSDIEKRHVLTHVPQIANILYARCISRFQNIYDFDEATALACIEVFQDCVSLVLSQDFAFKIEVLFPKITDTRDNKLSTSIAAILEEINKILQFLDSILQSQTKQDGHTKKMVAALCHLATVLINISDLECNALLTDSTNKLEQFVRTTQLDCSSLIPALLEACCRRHQEGALLNDLIDKLTAVMGVINDQNDSLTSDTESFPSVDDKTRHTVFGYGCAHVTARMRHAEHLMSRVKDLQAALKCCLHLYVEKINKDLKELFKCLVVQLAQISSWCGKLAKLQFPVGVYSDKILQTCVRLYNILAAFVKQVMTYVGQDAELLLSIRLERLLKISGKKLTTVMDNAIIYVDASEGSGRGAGASAAILKDTRYIPKLVLEMERFSDYCLSLSKKTKVDLVQYFSLGTARDFRIKTPVLHEILERRRSRVEEGSVESSSEVETIHSPAASDEENSCAAEEPVSKRRKTKIK